MLNVFKVWFHWVLWITFSRGDFIFTCFHHSAGCQLRIFRGDPRKSCSENFKIFLANIRSLQDFSKNGLQQRFQSAYFPKFCNSANFVLLKYVFVTVKMLLWGNAFFLPTRHVKGVIFNIQNIIDFNIYIIEIFIDIL